jgi:hypothetical protein
MGPTASAVNLQLTPRASLLSLLAARGSFGRFSGRWRRANMIVPSVPVCARRAPIHEDALAR